MSILSPKAMLLVATLIAVGLVGASCTALPASMEMPAESVAPEPQAVAPQMDLVGSGPDLAMQPTDQWMELGSGEYHWYAFTFDFDEDYTEPVEIRLFSEPEGAAILTIRNGDQADLWRKEGEHEHFGCCVVQEFGNDDDETPYSVWAGALESSGTYYIVVEHAKNMSEMANYRFELMGPGISVPDGLLAPTAMAPAPPMPAPAAQAVAPQMDPMGSGPDLAMQPTDQWMELDEGEYHWYAFNFDYDEDYTMPVEIRVFSEPKDAAILTIRNGEQADLWRREGEHEHFGCCVVQVFGNEDDEETPFAVWSGALESSGTYYIVVEHAKDVSGPAYYQFMLGGDGVSY